MIEKSNYEDIATMSQELKNCCANLKKVIANKDLSELEDFISTVDVYYKYLDSTIELHKDADEVIKQFLDRKN